MVIGHNILTLFKVAISKILISSLHNLIVWLRCFLTTFPYIPLTSHILTFDLRERMVAEYDSTGELLVDLGSDQTSCHNPFNGGYYPVQLSFEEANQVMTTDTVRFKNLVQER